jgi:hypothetical protein
MRIFDYTCVSEHPDGGCVATAVYDHIIERKFLLLVMAGRALAAEGKSAHKITTASFVIVLRLSKEYLWYDIAEIILKETQKKEIEILLKGYQY